MNKHLATIYHTSSEENDTTIAKARLAACNSIDLEETPLDSPGEFDAAPLEALAMELVPTLVVLDVTGAEALAARVATMTFKALSCCPKPVFPSDPPVVHRNPHAV